jgi:hypothetical protein
LSAKHDAPPALRNDYGPIVVHGVPQLLPPLGRDQAFNAET